VDAGPLLAEAPQQLGGHHAGLHARQQLADGSRGQSGAQQELDPADPLDRAVRVAPLPARRALRRQQLLLDAYAAAKAAQWSLTNGVRLELAGQGTLVTGVHLGSADTDMVAAFDVDKIDPADVARAALDGVEAGAIEVLVDDEARRVKASLAGDPAVFYGLNVPVA
jgi:NAD(P)-dependent dehydrogenase (short-subunit alcohol dehydrogenase family)